MAKPRDDGRKETMKLGGVTLRTQLPGDVVSRNRTSVTTEVPTTEVSGTKTPRVRRAPGPTVSPRTFPPTPLVR